MKRIILAFACLLFTTVSFAQKTKTGVVVFGTTPAGIAAAIQSAHSGVNTVLVDQGGFDVVNFTPADKAYKIGVYADFLKRVDSLQKKSNLKNNQSLVPAYVATVFKGWTDTIKNLTVFKRANIKNIEKDGKNWEIEFTDNREIKADVVVDASTDNFVAKRAKLNLDSVNFKPGVYSDKIYRTSVAMADIKGVYPSGIPAKFLMAANTENFLIIGGIIPQTLPVGQGAGATAAYCSFFNTTTPKIDIRKTQAELLIYKSQFIKFEDFSLADSNAASIQRIAITGILKGKVIDNKFLFMPDSSVSTEDIKLPLKEYYSRSQIWFLDHKSEKLTVEETLDLIKFTAGRGKELDREVEKGWATSLKLDGKFDLKAIITRKQLAILFDVYLRPFDRAVDLNGNLKS